MAGSIVPFILLVIAIVSQCSSAQHGRNQKAAMVVGTVLCDTCFHQQLSGSSRFISGATVAIECGDEKQSFNFRKEVQTDRHGKFRVELPFSVSHQTTRIRSCSVSLVKSNEPYCSVASMATTSSLGLKSRKAGRHVFSAGFFTFKPLQQPDLCYQKPTITSTSKYDVPRSPFVPPTKPTISSRKPSFPFAAIAELAIFATTPDTSPADKYSPTSATIIKAIDEVQRTTIKVSKLQWLQFTTCNSINSLPESSPFLYNHTEFSKAISRTIVVTSVMTFILPHPPFPKTKLSPLHVHPALPHEDSNGIKK